VAACAGPAKRFMPFRSSRFDFDRDHTFLFSKKRSIASDRALRIPTSRLDTRRAVTRANEKIARQGSDSPSTPK
jgi:hypothetical protein